MRFYLGTDRPPWMDTAGPPLFYSWHSIRRRRRPSLRRWALDSGGFTAIVRDGTYADSPAAYAAGVRRLATDVGGLDWAVIQDWPVAAPALERSGLTALHHQQRTVTSALELATLAADLPWAPVLTGITLTDYLRHADQYAAAGVNLAASPAVAVGALVGRPTAEVLHILDGLLPLGLPLHGLGIKGAALALRGAELSSADSMAWSFAARRAGRPLCSPDARHVRCNHCMIWAERWAEGLQIGAQLTLFPPVTLDNVPRLY